MKTQRPGSHPTQEAGPPQSSDKGLGALASPAPPSTRGGQAGGGLSGQKVGGTCGAQMEGLGLRLRTSAERRFSLGPVCQQGRRWGGSGQKAGQQPPS